MTGTFLLTVGPASKGQILEINKYKQSQNQLDQSFLHSFQWQVHFPLDK